jgi:mercuric ion binding protein
MNIMKQSFIAVALFAGALAFSPVAEAQTKETNKVEAVQQETTASFQVDGKCNMCKNRIETAVRELEGVKAANWDVKTKTLSVTYDSSKLEEAAIHEKVASVGHDTEKVKASDAAYNKLPGCCKYERV